MEQEQRKPRLERPDFGPAPELPKKKTVRLPSVQMMREAPTGSVVRWLVEAEKDSQEDRNAILENQDYNNKVSKGTNDAIWEHLENGADMLDKFEKMLNTLLAIKNLAWWTFISVLTFIGSVVTVSLGEYGNEMLKHWFPLGH